MKNITISIHDFGGFRWSLDKITVNLLPSDMEVGLILGLCLVNERLCYFVTMSLIGGAQT